jgi:phosphatidylcholine synthase
VYWAAWAVHLYTATGAVLAFLATAAVMSNDFRAAFIWLFVAVVVDGSDGALARLVRVHERLPRFSGEKVDDLVDYLTFVFVPALIVWRAELVPAAWTVAVVSIILVSSAYGFGCLDAKTADHFFTGFPSYWNIAALYLLVGGLPRAMNGAILLALAALVFVRVGYVYPTRTASGRRLTMVLTILWGGLVLMMILQLPNAPRTIVWLSLFFPIYYVTFSLILHARRARSDRAEGLAPLNSSR